MTSGLDRFAAHLPVRIRFGDGVLAELPVVLAELGVQRPLVVADPAVLHLAPVAAVLADLGDPPVHAIPAGEPTIDSVSEAGASLTRAGADGIVGLGGGSALDSAKAARLIAAHGAISPFLWPGDPLPVPPLDRPLVTVPTTAGTGSEVTGGIVLADHERGLKVAAPSPHNRAQACLVDPVLTHGLPPGPTLAGGLDVVSQAIGAITAATRQPIADAIALEALHLARDALPAVIDNGSDKAARNQLACGSLMAGLAMNLSEAGTDHSLGHALGMRHGIPHGLSVGVMIAEALDHDRRFVADRAERIADALGAPHDGTTDGRRAVTAVRGLLRRVGCPSLRALGVGEHDLAPLTEVALAGWIPIEPGPWSRDDVTTAFRQALQTER